MKNLFCSTILFFLSCQFTYAAFVVPTPETLPPTNTKTYYCDAITGNDTNPGTSGKPWKTLSKAQSTIADGDTVKLRSGDYGSFINNNIAHTNWTTYEADAGNTPIFSQRNTSKDAIRIYGYPDSYKANLIFRGITINHSGALVRNVSNVKIYDCNFVGTGYPMKVPYDVISMNDNYAINLANTSGIVIDNCTINGDGPNFDSYVGHDDSVRVSVVQGSPIVTGTNTTWTNAQVGKLFSCSYNVKYTVASVQSNTQLTLTSNYNEKTADGLLWGTSGPYEGNVGGIQGSEGGYGRGYGRGIYFTSLCQDVTITNCDVGSCDTAISGAGNSGIIISNNKIHHTTFDGITIKGSKSNNPVIIENNHIHDGIDMYLGRMYSSGSPILNDFAHNDFIQGLAYDSKDYILDNLIIRGNHLHHSDGDAMFLRGGYKSGNYNRNWTIENNLVYDMGLRHVNIDALPMVVLHNVDGCIFRNNTILCGKLSALKDTDAGKPVRFTQLTGNIIAIMAINVLEASGGYTKIDYEDYNIINQIVYGAHTIKWGNNTTVYNMYRQNPVSNVKFKALFSDYNNYDCTLAASSMAINHGNPSNYPETDITGASRSDHPDAGCFEHGSNLDSPENKENDNGVKQENE